MIDVEIAKFQMSGPEDVSGPYATDFEMDIPVKSNPAFPFTGKTDVELQTEYILDNLVKILKAAEKPFRGSEYLPIYQKGRALLHC
jgi:hypothetical protein